MPVMNSCNALSVVFVKTVRRNFSLTLITSALFTAVFSVRTLVVCRAGGRLVGPDGGIVHARPPQKLRVIVPPRSLTSPTMITCRLIAKERVRRPPQLREGQALVSRIVEVTPSALTFRRYVYTCTIKTSPLISTLFFYVSSFLQHFFDYFIAKFRVDNEVFMAFHIFDVDFVVVFTARRSYASAVLGVVILSVRPSVCPSHACFVTNPKKLPQIFFISHKRAILLVFCHPTVVGGRRPLPL